MFTKLHSETDKWLSKCMVWNQTEYLGTEELANKLEYLMQSSNP